VAGWMEAARGEGALGRAAILAMPSRWPEPFGLVGLEAARFGVPTVAFETGGIATWLAPGVNGLFVPPAAGASGFGAALASLLRDPVRLAALSAGATAAPARVSTPAPVGSLTPALAPSRSSGPPPPRAIPPTP